MLTTSSSPPITLLMRYIAPASKPHILAFTNAPLVAMKLQLQVGMCCRRKTTNNTARAKAKSNGG